MIEVTLVEANKWWVRFFHLIRRKAMILPGRRIVMLAYMMYEKDLINHECMHIEQVERLGSYSRFAAWYSWYFLRYGYYDNPFEIEAREYANY